MAQYIAFDPAAEVSGAVLLSLIAGTQERIVAALERHDVRNVEAAGWYPQQAMLDALREFGQMADLVSIGMRIPEHAEWPPDVDSIHKAFDTLDVAYHLNHRNGEIGSYQVERVGERALDVVVENPYPCDFDYGLMFGLARRYLPPESALKVVHDDHAPCRQKGGGSCTYHVTW